MRLVSALLFSGLMVSASLALARDDGYWRGDYMNREQYENRYEVLRPGPDDMAEIRACLDSWPNNPFGYTSNLTARIITATVKVLGIGESINDTAKTDFPQLIYIKPSVNVLSQAEMHLLNPNGWYCLRANVTVLSEIKVMAHCRAHITSSRSDVTVLGSTSGERSSPGVTVLGKVIVENAECD